MIEYTDLKNIVQGAWIEFYQHLANNGVTDNQINKLDALLDTKDCFNDVMDCVVGATFHE